jgi:hypothetical protein
MKRRDLEWHRRDAGCVLHHHGGGHDVWLNPASLRKSTLPRHNEVKAALVVAICRQLGVSAPDSVA